MPYSVGIGATNRCNYHCTHCYSREAKTFDLQLDDIKKVIGNVDVGSINWGTGENILNPGFPEIIDHVHAQGIKMSLTSNGYSVAELPDERLKYFNDIDISLDFANRKQNDTMRGENSYRLALEAIEKLKKLQIECSLVTCLTNENHTQIENVYKVAREVGVNLRLNIYKPVHNKELSPTYDQFWSSMTNLFDQCNVISCSEPVVLAAQNRLAVFQGCNCGRNSFRVTPDRRIIPCVYWNTSDLTIDDLALRGEAALTGSREFLRIRERPEYCLDCEFLPLCEGGCAARRLYNNFQEPDPYCFKYHRRDKPVIAANAQQHKDLVHSGYLCTIIMA